MKIAIICPSDFSESGGSFTYSHLILKELLRKDYFEGHKVVIYTDSIHLELDKIAPPYIEFRQLPKQGNFLFAYMYRKIRKALTLLSTFLSDTKGIYFSSSLSEYLVKEKCHFAWSLTPLGEPLDIPYATTVWDLQFRAQPFFPELGTKGEWERRQTSQERVIRRAAITIVGTKHGANEIKQFFGVSEERILVAPFPRTYNSLDSSLTRNKNLIFYPAQFWPHKNHINLLLGFQRAQKICGTDLVLILPGSDKGNLQYVRQTAKELGLLDYVTFPGFISNSELQELYKLAGLMVFPSLCGPDNLPPLEALSNNCPLAASDIPGAREYLPSTTIFFNPLSPGDICEAIVTGVAINLTPTLLQEENHMGQGNSAEVTLGLISQRIKEFESFIINWKPIH